MRKVKGELGGGRDSASMGWVEGGGGVRGEGVGWPRVSWALGERGEQGLGKTFTKKRNKQSGDCIKELECSSMGGEPSPFNLGGGRNTFCR